MSLMRRPLGKCGACVLQLLSRAGVPLSDWRVWTECVYLCVCRPRKMAASPLSQCGFLGLRPASCTEWMCMRMLFLLCPDLFIKKKTHLHKKALEHRKNVHFVFLSVAPRHVGFQLPLRGV